MCGNHPAIQLLQKQFKAYSVQWGSSEEVQHMATGTCGRGCLCHARSGNRNQGPGQTIKGLPLIAHLL